MHARRIASAVFVALMLAAAAAAQPAVQPGLSAQELYHVHIVKAAPGKMNELIAAFRQAPVAPGEPGPPVIFRHLQGDDWDLLVLTPLGKEETLRPVDTPEVQKSVQQMRPLRTQHGDTFTAGPPWTEVRATLMGGGPAPTAASGSAATETAGTAGSSAGGASVPETTIYTVTTYRSLPGHRDQLADTLRRIVALYPDRRTLMQHVEGAPWEFVLISRYDSWSALGEEEAAPAERLRAQGFANNEAIGQELRQHTAEHRDTIARMVR
jgi:hypothetical protein